MKHCNHCGVSIKGNAAAFCPKCKKPLKKSQKGKRPVRKNPPQKPKLRKKKPPENKIFRFRLWLSGILNPENNKKTDVEPVSVIIPADENYDGYYDDKLTDDNEEIKEALNPELIKRIAFISGGTLIIVIFAIILINLL